ncbi:MAG: hypothetical protein WDA00_03655 [Eubacteriales bacterium]
MTKTNLMRSPFSRKHLRAVLVALLLFTCLLQAYSLVQARFASELLDGADGHILPMLCYLDDGQGGSPTLEFVESVESDGTVFLIANYDFVVRNYRDGVVSGVPLTYYLTPTLTPYLLTDMTMQINGQIVTPDEQGRFYATMPGGEAQQHECTLYIRISDRQTLDPALTQVSLLVSLSAIQEVPS